MLWDANDSKHLYSLQAGSEIHALAFSPNRYWLAAATEQGIVVFNLEHKNKLDGPKLETVEGVKNPACVSLTWSHDGNTLFAGYTDNNIRVWQYI